MNALCVVRENTQHTMVSNRRQNARDTKRKNEFFYLNLHKCLEGKSSYIRPKKFPIPVRVLKYGTIRKRDICNHQNVKVPIV